MNEPSVGTAIVPWDPAELQGRTCSACACYFESVNATDPKQFQGFCRRQPADLTEVRTQVPRLDSQQRPVIRDGQPVMNNERLIGFLFKATQREGTCFDGWREKGTLPGNANSQRQLQAMATMIERLATQVLPPTS